MPAGYPPAKRLRALLLCALAGFCGVHRFYLRRPLSATLQLALLLVSAAWIARVVPELPAFDLDSWPIWLHSLLLPSLPLLINFAWFHLDLFLILTGRLEQRS